MNRRAWVWMVFLLVLATAPAAVAQTPVNVDTLRAPAFSERTPWENGILSRFGMDRVALGPRSIGMGGTGIALLGGPEYQVLNPAAILGVRRPELESEAKIYSGSAGTNNVPAQLDLGNGQTLTANDYRVRPREVVDYHSLSFGLPVTLLGRRGVVAGTYSRVASTGTQDETRVELRGPITQQADATFGLGILPKDGMDAVSLAIARDMTNWFGVGVNLNWLSGTLMRNDDIGVSIFGFPILNAFSEFSQDVSGFNVDFGGRLEAGPVKAGGAVYMKHDLTFENARSKIRPVGDPSNPGQQLLIFSQPLDNTLTVPTMFSVGLAFEPMDRLTVTGDFWYRPWSKSEITRARIEPVIGFFDPDDPESYFFHLYVADDDTNTVWGREWEDVRRAFADSTTTEETFNAGFDDTHSFRLGLEYQLIDKPDFGLPVRVGFRTEKLTMNNVTVPTFYGLLDSTGLVRKEVDYIGLIGELYEGAVTGDTLTADIARQLANVAEYNHMLFKGDGVKSTAITLGFGVRWRNFEADLGVERVSYDIDRFFLQEFDPLFSPVAAVVRESRHLTNISFAARMHF